MNTSRPAPKFAVIHPNEAPEIKVNGTKQQNELFTPPSRQTEITLYLCLIVYLTWELSWPISC